MDDGFASYGGHYGGRHQSRSTELFFLRLQPHKAKKPLHVGCMLWQNDTEAVTKVLC